VAKGDITIKIVHDKREHIDHRNWDKYTAQELHEKRYFSLEKQKIIKNQIFRVSLFLSILSTAIIYALVSYVINKSTDIISDFNLAFFVGVKIHIAIIAVIFTYSWYSLFKQRLLKSQAYQAEEGLIRQLNIMVYLKEHSEKIEKIKYENEIEKKYLYDNTYNNHKKKLNNRVNVK